MLTAFKLRHHFRARTGARRVTASGPLVALLTLLLLPAAAVAQTPAAESTATRAWVAFEVPAGQRPVGYVVGFFESESHRSPIFSYRVEASDAAAEGSGSVRLPLRGWQAPIATPLVVRVRSVTESGQSAWSAPSGVIATAELARLEPRTAIEAPSGKAARQGEATKADADGGKPKGTAKGRNAAAKAEAFAAAVQERVRTETALRQALTVEFPGVDLDASVQGYQKLENFVGALYAAKTLEIPLASLKADTTGRRTALEAAVQRLKPSADAKKEARKARQAARRLIKGAKSAATGKDGKGEPPAASKAG